MGIDDLLRTVRTYLSEDDVNKIEQAYQFADKAHAGQFRKSGEPYIHHPVAVASILADLQLDAVTIVAALLHDTVEDTAVTLEEIRERFGDEVARLVDGVTKLRRLKYQSKEEQQAENHRKMLVAMAKDIRVILIKLADRLHNMRTLQYLPEEKQKRIAEETLEIFAPLAHRLGIASIKWELEDIALRYLNPQQYYRIVNLMKKKRQEREQYLEEVIAKLRDKLNEVGIKADISGRPKHIYSIYRKMVTQNKQFNEIYDLIAVRVIVDTVRDCYAVLGIVHTMWKPMPGRFKDYIAMPKPNMYQSLHTTVIGPNGEPMEVQIRTWEMHRTAEYGIAAHWAYKEGRTKLDDPFEKKLSWFREILEWQQDFRDAQEFLESLKVDLFSDQVFVFTPKGDVIELPKGAVPLDFAYRIHTEVGNRCIGAKVNGKIVPLDYELKTGDIVEILTSKHSYGPSQDWLKIAKTSQARNKIRQWFKKQRREEAIAKGREAIVSELEKHGPEAKEMLTNENLARVASQLNFQSADDLLAAVGYGEISPGSIAGRLREHLRQEREETIALPEVRALPRKKQADNGVRVQGMENLLVRFSRCCNPVPGDEIIGYVTRGRGVSIHRKDCPNVKHGCAPERLLPAEWEVDAPDTYYPVDIEIKGLDRRGLLNEVLQAVAETKTNITEVQGRTDRNRLASIHMTLAIRNLEHLHRVVEQIKKVRDIYAVQRVMQ